MGSLSNELVEPFNGEVMPALDSFCVLVSCWMSEYSWAWIWDRNWEEYGFPLGHPEGAGWDHSLVKHQAQSWAISVRLPIPLRRQTSKGGCWLKWEYSQPSISYRICFSNYLYFSLMTQHEAKLPLAELQVAERSRAFGHVSSTCWSVLQPDGQLLSSVFCVNSRDLKGPWLSVDTGVWMGFLFFNSKQRKCLPPGPADNDMHAGDSTWLKGMFPLLWP